MRCFSLVSIVLSLSALAAWPAIAPVPEAEQAARAMVIIDAYHSPRPPEPPKKLHVVYFTPADRDPAAKYEQRLEAILQDIRAFYRDNLERLGFGPKTFSLARGEQGKCILHLVKGREPENAFTTVEGKQTGSPASGDKVRRACEPALGAAGISLDHETVLIFCHLAAYDEGAGTFRHHSPYFGLWTQQSGLCFAADWAQLCLDNLTRNEPLLNDAEYGRMSLGKHMTIFTGGIAHELGHAFALPHSGERRDERPLGTSLMGAGNHTYREERRSEGKGSFLTMASAMRLASRPLFNGSAKGEAQPGQLQRCELVLSTNVTRADLAGRPAALRVEGSVAGSPPVYGVIAYFDTFHDGGYRAPTATSVPDDQGRFAIEVSDLATCGSGTLRLEFCHANGAVTERHLDFSVTPDRRVDLSQWELRRTLAPLGSAVARNDLNTAQAELKQLLAGPADDAAKAIARALFGALSLEAKPNPAESPATLTRLALGDAQAQTAEVGWLRPSANRVPSNDQVTSPLLDSGTLYATGLYAHAPSRYVFCLGKKWQRLNGEAGIHTLHQPYGSVTFLIKTNGHEAFRSGTIRGTQKTSYQVQLSGVSQLELIVDPTPDGNGNDWGLWLNPVLSR